MANTEIIAVGSLRRRNRQQPRVWIFSTRMPVFTAVVANNTNSKCCCSFSRYYSVP